MPNKDPAFLFYSKDWLQGTAKMFCEEKGVYIDLLAHHHQDGFLPKDTKRLAKMVGLADDKFEQIWVVLSEKFIEKDGKLYNKKLETITEKRAEFSEMRTIIGLFGQKLKHLFCSDEEKKRIRSKFNYASFLSNDKQTLSKDLDVWLSTCLSTTPPNVGNGNGNVILNNKIENPLEAPEEKNLETSDSLEMQKEWLSKNKDYPSDKEKDLQALYEISVFIIKQLQAEKEKITGIRNQKITRDEIVKKWAAIVLNISANDFWNKKPLSSIKNNIQEFWMNKNGNLVKNKVFVVQKRKMAVDN